MAFDRLLARMFDPNCPTRDAWVLKGGYALEMRFHQARATKDLDLTVRVTASGPAPSAYAAAALRERLQIAAAVELAEFFVFNVGEPGLELNQAPERGSRFPVDARVDGRTFAKFHVDPGIGDVVLLPLDILSGQDWLEFAGIPGVEVPALSGEQQWAEKLHAYTLPREGSANTRVKDLVDIVLMIERGALSLDRIRVAVEATFGRRQTHPIPDNLPLPPRDWAKPFLALAVECGLDDTAESGCERLRAFWQAVRAG